MMSHTQAAEAPPSSLTMSVSEAAELTGLSLRAVYTQAAAGQIPAVRFGRRWQILRAPLLARLQQLAPEPAVDPLG